MNLLELAKRLQAVAQAGLTYTSDPFDIERFQEVQDLGLQLMASHTGLEKTICQEFFNQETGFPTPKVDVRGVVFQENRILMVREKMDGKWSLPGGWADIGLSPREVVVKEVSEESGLHVTPHRLLAVYDKKRHSHPPSPYHLYKLFIECDIIGGELLPGMETLDAGFFPLHALPELSVNRVTIGQIHRMFELHQHPSLPPDFD